MYCTLDFLIFFGKNKNSHLVELKKLENNIQDQIGRCKSVGVSDRPQTDHFCHSLLEFFDQVMAGKRLNRIITCSFVVEDVVAYGFKWANLVLNVIF